MASQDEALCGQWVRRLSEHRTVEYSLVAVNGLDSPGLVELLSEAPSARFEPTLLIHCAVPPMQSLKALPQPLRWFMGRWAREMNRLLERSLAGHGKRAMHRHPPASASQGLAADGFHPGPHGYALWAEGRSRHILSVH